MKNKGFTLIELLVVVAIIGILATVVLASLGSARKKAKDASVRATLSAMRAQAELQYDGDYDDVCNYLTAPTTSGEMFASGFDNATSVLGTNVMCIDEDGYTAGVPGSTAGIAGQGTQGAGPDGNGSLWAATLSLSDDTWFCVDSSGAAVNTTTNTRPISPFTTPLPDKTC